MSNSLNWTTVCHVDDLSDNIGVCASVNDKQVAIFKLSNDETLYAIDNHDPFSGANVISRGLVGCLQERTVVASPIYKQHFELATGQCLEDDSVTIPTYDVRITEGNVEVAA